MGKTVLKLSSHLAKSRHGVYYFRFSYRIGSAVKEKRVSLQTKNPQVAKVKAMQLSVMMLHRKNNYLTNMRPEDKASSEPEVMINDKYRTAIQVRNYKRLFVASNEDWAVPVAAEGDRRYFVIDCNPRYKGQTSGDGFFARYNVWLNNGGLEAVFHALQNRNITRFNPRVFPTTKARVDMMIRSLSPAFKFIFELLNGSALMRDETLLKASNATERWQRNSLYGDHLEWCRSQGIRYVPNADDFGKAMSKAFCFEQDNPHWRSNWKTRKDGYFYEMPTKRECMKRYAKNICVAFPEVVFFDYPTSGGVPMDETSEAAILNLFKQA